MKKSKLLLIVFVLLLSIYAAPKVNAQCGKFEPPPGKALLIIGQDLDATGGLSNYSNGYVEKVAGTTTGMFPGGVTTYTDLTYNLGLYNQTDYGAGPLRAQSYVESANYANTVISIGLDLQSGQLDQAANGSLDGNLNNLINWINAQNPRPVFLRIGYEFNASHNGYNGNTYINAWKHIVDKFRTANVSNVAFVWQADDSQMAEANLMAWYPGDSYVDWVGFSKFQGNGGGMIQFARDHKKPCMIAEATPMGHHTATEDGTTLWNAWYAPLLNMIHSNNDVIKALAYINQNWDSQPIWNNTFGDSRLQVNPTLLANWTTEMKTPFWLHASTGLFSNLKTGCSGGVAADFIANATRMYDGASTTFTNRSSGNINTYAWDFGAGANPATASSIGPIKVTYTGAGLKTVTLTVTGPGGLTNTIAKTAYINVEAVPTSSCMLIDDFLTVATVSKFAGAPNAFTHSQSGSDWVITSAKGFGEWDSWQYKFNDGNVVKSFNFSHPTLTKPFITLKVKKKAATPGTHSNAILKIDMFDRISATDGVFTTNKLELTETYQTITVDLSGKLFNKYGCSMAGCGILDSTNMVGLQFALNPGYASYPLTVNGTLYNDYFVGDIDIDMVSIGTGCGNVIIADFNADKLSVDVNQPVNFSSASVGTVSSYSWNFGSGATPATSASAGPVSVTYSTYGLKTVSLTVTGPNGTSTKTKAGYVNVVQKTSTCKAFYSDPYNGTTPSKFITSVVPGVFTFGASNGIMTVTSAGHGEWDYVSVGINDGAIASPVDITTNQKLYIKVKASSALGLRISLIDANGNEAGNNSLPAVFDKDVTTAWQTFAIDYTGNLSGTWFSKGPLDVTKIAQIALRPNAGFKSSPMKPQYNTAFVGTINIDWIALGDSTGCTGTLITGLTLTEGGQPTLIAPNPFNGETAISLDKTSGETQIIVRDLRGGEVYNEISIEKNVYLGKDLKQGMYILQTINKDAIQTFKIIKTE